MTQLHHALSSIAAWVRLILPCRLLHLPGHACVVLLIWICACFSFFGLNNSSRAASATQRPALFQKAQACRVQGTTTGPLSHDPSGQHVLVDYTCITYGASCTRTQPYASITCPAACKQFLSVGSPPCFLLEQRSALLRRLPACPVLFRSYRPFLTCQPLSLPLPVHQVGRTHTCESMRATTERAHARTLGSLPDRSIGQIGSESGACFGHALPFPACPCVPAFSLVQTDGSSSACGHGEGRGSLLGRPCRRLTHILSVAPFKGPLRPARAARSPLSLRFGQTLKLEPFRFVAFFFFSPTACVDNGHCDLANKQ
jgi:hypothetical protein